MVAKAGIDAGVRGTLGANLKDNNDDGKVHLDEFVANLRSGPECIFDLEGSVDAFFEAFIKVGLSTPFGFLTCLLYTSPSPRDRQKSRMPSSA